jgi:hypothetical protein
MLPVVGEVENRLEALAAEDPGHGVQVAPVRLDVADDAVTEVVVIAPVEHRDVVTAGDQSLHRLATHELGAADYEDSHTFSRWCIDGDYDPVAAGQGSSGGT